MTSRGQNDTSVKKWVAAKSKTMSIELTYVKTMTNLQHFYRCLENPLWRKKSFSLQCDVLQPVNLGHLPDLLTPITATWELASEQILSIKLQLQFFKCSCALCSEIWGGKQACNAVIAFDGWVLGAQLVVPVVLLLLLTSWHMVNERHHGMAGARNSRNNTKAALAWNPARWEMLQSTHNFLQQFQCFCNLQMW